MSIIGVMAMYFSTWVPHLQIKIIKHKCVKTIEQAWALETRRQLDDTMLSASKD